MGNKFNPEFYKRKQVCLKGTTLKMFEYDVKQREEKESRLLCEIVKEHYKLHPPLGYFKDQTR